MVIISPMDLELVWMRLICLYVLKMIVIYIYIIDLELICLYVYVEDEMVFQKNEILTSITICFAHFVCGVLFETDKRNRLFGSDIGRSSTTLAAPSGTCLMEFYGSIGGLFETIGCYVVVNDGNRGNKNKQTGVTKLSQNKNKIKKHQSQHSVLNQVGNNIDEEGDVGTYGGSSNTNTAKKKKRKKWRPIQIK